MHDLLVILTLFAVGSVSGFINVMAGGGSTLTMPILMIFLGLDGAMANGTNRVAVFLQNVSAVASFRQEEFHEFPESLKLSIFALPGAVLGAIYANAIDDKLFERLLAGVMILVMISVLIPMSGKKWSGGEGKGRWSWLIYPAMVGIGFYGGFLQVGVGFLLMASMRRLLKLDLVRVNMHKVFIVLIYTLPALLIFVLNRNVHWLYGLNLAAGNMFGAWWSAKISVRKGERVIRYVLGGAIALMSLKLLDVF